MNNLIQNHVDSFNENYWCDNLIEYNSLLDDVATPIDIYWSNQNLQNPIVDVSMDVTVSETTSHVSEGPERECPRKRGRTDPCAAIGTKACRERMRREKLNERFAELSATLEPGKPVKTDKSSILGDAIRILKELKTESEEYKEMNESVLEEIKLLKAEKNELREEKLALKADKQRIEQQMKTMNVPPTRVMPVNSPVYQTGANKMTMFPSYGFVPMWQYLPPCNRDTSQDQELRPPAA